MSMVRFLESLREGGRVTVPVPGAQSDLAPIHREQQLQVRPLLESMDADWRLELAGQAPQLSLPAARWGAETLYRGCQFLVCREIPLEQMRETLERPAPGAVDAEVCYSVDLCLRFLPDLIGLARAVSKQDPLLKLLVELGTRWPLSSVGVTGIPSVDVKAFMDDGALRQLYVDRILEQEDAPRLRNPEVRRAVRESLGAHTVGAQAEMMETHD